MSLKYIDKDGNLINCSGLTPGGNLEAGAVAQRSGTITIGDVTANTQDRKSTRLNSSHS